MGAAFREAPMLEIETMSGTLPPVSERLPLVPLMVQVEDGIGKYRGTLRLPYMGPADQVAYYRYLSNEQLLRWSPGWNRIIPNLAVSFATFDSHTRFEFKLRKGLRWSDGHPFTSEDILFWAESIASDPIFNGNPGTFLGKRFKVRAPSAHEVTFEFEEPFVQFLSLLASPRGVGPTSFPAHWFRKPVTRIKEDFSSGLKGKDLPLYRKMLAPVRLVTSEAPRLDAWIFDENPDPLSNGRPARFSRNPYYWKIDAAGNQLPYINHVHFVPVESQDSVEDSFLKQRIHLDFLRLNQSTHKSAFQQPPLSKIYNMGALRMSQSSAQVICFNLTHKDPRTRALFQRKDFRIAISLSLDRKTLSGEYPEELGLPYQAAPVPTHPAYHRQLATQFTEYDPERAARIFDQLGLPMVNGLRQWRNGDPFHFTMIIPDDSAHQSKEAIKRVVDMLRSQGLDIRLSALSIETRLKVCLANEHDATIWSGGGGQDPMLNPKYYAPIDVIAPWGMAWYHHLNSPRHPEAEPPPPAVQAIMDRYLKMSSSKDPKEQERVFGELLQLAADFFPNVGTCLKKDGYFIYSKQLRNIPRLAPSGWTYPTPAPINPCQFFFAEP